MSQLQLVPQAEPSLPKAEARRAGDLSSSRWSSGSRDLIKNKARALFAQFPGALSGDEEAIHQLRVESRRMRVAVALLADKPDGRRAKRARRILRQMTRAAGVSRDLDVLFEIYDQRLKELPVRTPEQARLRKRLADARRRGRSHMVEAFLDLEIAQLRGELRAIVASGCSPIPVVDERIRDLVLREGQALGDGFAALGARRDPVELHALRRRARRLRYGVEVAQKILDEDKGATKPWKALQDLIGSMHDYHVLAEWLRKQATDDRRRGNRKMAVVATAEAAWAEATVVRLHDQFLASRPGVIVQQGLSLLNRRM